MIVTRFAPSPTGFLHLGHAFAALTAARAGARFLLRIEDLDSSRCREEFVAAIYEDLHWLGLAWEMPVLRQSERGDAYRVALSALERLRLVYPCFCTRKAIADEIARAVEAPHAFDLATSRPGPDGPIYPGTCRALSDDERGARLTAGVPHALRLDWRKAAALVGPLTFEERGRGVVAVEPGLFGDVVLARKDMPAAYHLAVVIDDAYQGVSLVTRGNDLLAATHVQRLLQKLLELPEPHYAHHRLILDATGRKFSKRDRAVTLRSLREDGATPRDIRARIGFE
jgi:glutamyl-Q tRNA(Asp) synthetase